MQIATAPSRKPRAMRKRFHTATMRQRYREMSSPLTTELAANLRTSRLPLHEGDEVVVMSGKYKAQTGVIRSVCRATRRVTIKSIHFLDRRGLAVYHPFVPCKLRIVKPFMNSSREKIIKRRAASA